MTGTTSPGDLPAPIARLWDAARSGDLATMRAQIDFAVSGVSLIVRALWELDPQDRDKAARAGVAELESVGTQADLAGPALQKLARALCRATYVRAADAVQTEKARAALRVPRLPEEIAPESRARLGELAALALAVGAVYDPVMQDEQWLLAMVSDDERVAPVRLARDGSLVAEPLRW